MGNKITNLKKGVSMDQQIFKAAKFLVAWDGKNSIGDNLRYKLLEVPREAVDEDSDDCNAHLLIGLDSGNVRRVDEMLDMAYDRAADIDVSVLIAAIECAPDDAKDILNEYVAEAKK
jgi:hypothetical protein